jgi:hypothetical protein
MRVTSDAVVPRSRVSHPSMCVPVTHLATQRIQVGFWPDLCVRRLLCSRTPSCANLAELATCFSTEMLSTPTSS